jgi:hypothetical protein
MIRNAMLLSFGALLLGMAPMVMAQAAPGGTAPEAPDTVRAPDSNDMDKPTAPVKVVIPAPAGVDPGAGTTNPGDEHDNPDVPEEINEDPPEENPTGPTFFGEPVAGKFVWVLDRSGSMGAVDSGSGPIEDASGSIVTNPNRIMIVKSECIRVLNQLSEDDWFALVSFGGGPDVSSYAELVPATSGNKQSGVNTVSQLVASGGTPAYPALQTACTQYNSHDLNKIYFLCDGGPNVGGGAAQILSDFPGWFQSQKDRGCELVCVHIGDSGAAAQFMQALANGNGGTYIHK